MEKKIERATEFQELAQFLAEMNQHKHSHIGYCGENLLEIEQTLAEDFIDENGNAAFFAVRKETGELTATVGLDIDEESAEVWGPFNQSATTEEQAGLWEACMQAYPALRKFYFFLNEENRQQQHFVQQLGARKTGEHLTLLMSKDQMQPVEGRVSKRFAAEDEKAFRELHDAEFPRTYYDAQTIISRLNDEHILHVMKTEADGLIGYAYFEVDPEMKEASLEYIAISPAARNRGLGTILLKEILAEMFGFPGIENIQLCVDNVNDQANHVYVKAGFKRKDTLYSYVLER
ncbi:MAG: GNAT family N-acetyltransferase [Lysinibacillus sp.]